MIEDSGTEDKGEKKEIKGFKRPEDLYRDDFGPKPPIIHSELEFTDADSRIESAPFNFMQLYTSILKYSEGNMISFEESIDLILDSPEFEDFDQDLKDELKARLLAMKNN